MFFKSVLRALHKIIKFWHRGKKRSVDSVSKGKEHKGFRESAKICLILCSEGWLKSSCNLVHSFIPSGS